MDLLSDSNFFSNCYPISFFAMCIFCEVGHPKAHDYVFAATSDTSGNCNYYSHIALISVLDNSHYNDITNFKTNVKHGA
jgi:hypothetical protein